MSVIEQIAEALNCDCLSEPYWVDKATVISESQIQITMKNGVQLVATLQQQ